MENSDITINGLEATWTMPSTVGDLGGTYTGKFVFLCHLNPLKQLQAGREFRELLGSLAVQATETEYSLAYALSHLRHLVIKAPPFWTSPTQESNMPGNIGDLNIIMLVLDASDRAKKIFNEQIKKERDDLLDENIKLSEELLEKGE